MYMSMCLIHLCVSIEAEVQRLDPSYRVGKFGTMPSIELPKLASSAPNSRNASRQASKNPSSLPEDAVTGVRHNSRGNTRQVSSLVCGLVAASTHAV